MPNTVDSLTVPEMPISDEVYTNENEIPKNGVGYNVAVLLNNYPESASPPIVLPNGVESTLTVSNATAVTDQVTISDTNAATISIDISKWMKFIPTSASYTKSLGVTYAN